MRFFVGLGTPERRRLRQRQHRKEQGGKLSVHRSPGICLPAEENPGKPQLGYRRRRLCHQSSPQMGPLTSKWGRWDRTVVRKEGRNEVNNECSCCNTRTQMVLATSSTISEWMLKELNLTTNTRASWKVLCYVNNRNTGVKTF